MNNDSVTGYDGACAMSGQFKGVQSEIRRIYPKAIYVHCASHSLNLTLSKSCQVNGLLFCIGVMQ